MSFDSKQVRALEPERARAVEEATDISDAVAADESGPEEVRSAVGASAVALLSQPPDPALFAGAELPNAAVPSSDDSGSQPALAGEPVSLTPSVADVDVQNALQQARKGTRSRAVFALAAVVLLGAGVGFGIHSQKGPTSVSKAPDPLPKVVEAPAPKAAAPAVIEKTPALEAKLEAPPAANEPATAEAAPGSPAADFAAAFAAAPNPNAKAYPEVIVRVSPLGAQIYDGTKLLAQTAAKVALAAGEKKTLTVHLAGHHSRQVLVDGSSESVNIIMLPAGGAAKAPAETQSGAATPLERSFVVESQQQAAAKAAPKAAPKPAKKEAASGDILPPL